MPDIVNIGTGENSGDGDSFRASFEKINLAFGQAPLNAQTGTTYTWVLGDAGYLITYDNAAAIAVMIPTNAAVAFPVGTVIAGAQLGAGLVTLTGDTGVVVNGVSGGSVVSAGQWSTWSATKLATDTWLVSGGLA